MSLQQFILNVNDSRENCKPCFDDIDVFQQNFEKFQEEFNKYNNSMMSDELKSDYIFGRPYSTR